MKDFKQKFKYLLLLFFFSLGFFPLLSCSNFTEQYFNNNKSEDPPGNSGVFSRGCEFYIGFPQNYDNAASTQFLLHITGTQNTSGSVEIPGLSFSSTFDVNANEITTVELPTQVSSSNNDVIENYSIHVTTLEPVTIHGLNKGEHTSDGFLALPVKSLDNEYYIMSYNSGIGKSLFMIIATENNTSIEITPTADAGSRLSGDPFIIIMNAGETYQLKGKGVNSDLTGTHISSEKPVAVLSGSSMTQIPKGVSAGDHIIDFMPPVSSWGTHFYIPSYSIPPISNQPMPFTFRILAVFENTNISINNQNYTLNSSGDFFEQVSDSSIAVSSDKPVLVAKFLHGANSISTANHYGDPSMIIIQPETKFLDNYTFCTAHKYFDKNYISLVVLTDDLPELKLNNTPVNISLFHIIDEFYSGAYIPVTSGTHEITGISKFGLIIFGFENYESYGMSGG